MPEELSPESKLYIKEEIENAKKGIKEEIEKVKSKSTKIFTTVVVVVGLLTGLGIYGIALKYIDAAIERGLTEKGLNELLGQATTHVKKINELLVEANDSSTSIGNIEKELKERLNGDVLFINEKDNVGIGTNQPTAKLDVNGTILGIGIVPPGAIVMFSGDVNNAFDAEGTGRKDTPYEGWQLCNGKNGSPDLQDRFIAASGQNYKIGDKGGSDTVVLKLDQLPSHNHRRSTGDSPPLKLNYGGVQWNSKGRGSPGGIVLYNDQSDLPNNRPNQITTEVKGHKKGPEPAVKPLTHRHSIPDQGSGAPVDIRPSFYAMAFIMRLP